MIDTPSAPQESAAEHRAGSGGTQWVVAPEVLAWFERAARFLSRPDTRCPEHGVSHTGKLARAIVLELRLFELTGQEQHRQGAIDRARYVVDRLGQDPQHGGWIFLPGRLEPRNCSTSTIDSGECADALVRLLESRDAVSLSAADHTAFSQAVTLNAESYLRTAVLEKAITNQVLWGAMGLAAAHSFAPHDSWRVAVEQAVGRALAEQRPDGSWGYEPVHSDRHAPASDTTVYYHSRCIAFLQRILECAPDLDPNGKIGDALHRALDFLAGVITPDGLKPLALEGKRWFWDGPYEAGSNAYDVYALLAGARRFGEQSWAALAERCWRQLARHLEGDGESNRGSNEGIRACLEKGVEDFVCRDFHTADLAWTILVAEQLPAPNAGGVAASADRAPRGGQEVANRVFGQAGVLRLDTPQATLLLRTAKQPRTTLFGGAVAGLPVYAGSDDNRMAIEREAALVEGGFTLFPHRPALIASLHRFLKENPARLDGRQWLFCARLLLARRRPKAAARRLWRGYVRSLLAALSDPAASHWDIAPEVTSEGTSAQVVSRVARTNGVIPDWAGGVLVNAVYQLAENGVHVAATLKRRGSAHGSDRARWKAIFVIPVLAQDVLVQADGGRLVQRDRHRLTFWPTAAEYRLHVEYTL